MKPFNLFPIALLLSLSSCKLSNIYTDLQITSYEVDVDTIIQKVTNTYGGQQNWRNIKTASTTLKDEWPTFHWRLLANPWKDQTTRLNFDWQPNSNNSRIKIITGKNQELGIQNWATYSVKDSSIVFKEYKKIKFHLPTMEYFFEFPFRIQEATKLKYGGTK